MLIVHIEKGNSIINGTPKSLSKGFIIYYYFIIIISTHPVLKEKIANSKMHENIQTTNFYFKMVFWHFTQNVKNSYKF